MATTETRGPQAAPYEAVVPSDVAAVIACGANYHIVDEPETNMAVAMQTSTSTQPHGPGDFGKWMKRWLDKGFGVVLTLPSFKGHPPGAELPAREGLDLFCQPDPDIAIQPQAWATNSLNEAHRVMMAGHSMVVREPKKGWIELAPPQRAGLSLGWGALAVAGVAVAALGYAVLGGGR